MFPVEASRHVLKLVIGVDSSLSVTGLGLPPTAILCAGSPAPQAKKLTGVKPVHAAVDGTAFGVARLE